jgi:intein/homing endonuclease
MCVTPSNEDVMLYDEARRAYREGDLEKLRSVYEKLLEANANPEIVYIVRRMVDDLEKKVKSPART